jgi:TonB-dependent starch-binding outer membrane protein SusC
LELYSSDEYNQQLIEFIIRQSPFEEQITKQKLVQWQQSGSNTIDVDGGQVQLSFFIQSLTIILIGKRKFSEQGFHIELISV